MPEGVKSLSLEASVAEGLPPLGAPPLGDPPGLPLGDSPLGAPLLGPRCSPLRFPYSAIEAELTASTSLRFALHDRTQDSRTLKVVLPNANMDSGIDQSLDLSLRLRTPL